MFHHLLRFNPLLEDGFSGLGILAICLEVELSVVVVIVENSGHRKINKTGESRVFLEPLAHNHVPTIEKVVKSLLRVCERNRQPEQTSRKEVPSLLIILGLLYQILYENKEALADECQSVVDFSV